MITYVATTNKLNFVANIFFPFFVVHKLLELWDSVSRRAEQRSHQLETMLTDSQQFHELTDELCNWLGKMEQTLDTYSKVSDKVEVLQGQLESQKVVLVSL